MFLELLSKVLEFFIGRLNYFKKIAEYNSSKLDIISILHLYTLIVVYVSILAFIVNILSISIIGELGLPTDKIPKYLADSSLGVFQDIPSLSIPAYILAIFIFEKIHSVIKSVYVKQVSEILGVLVVTTLCIGSFQITVLCLVPICSSLLATQIGSGKFSNFYQNVAFFIEVFTHEISESQKSNPPIIKRVLIYISVFLFTFLTFYLIIIHSWYASALLTLTFVISLQIYNNSNYKSINIVKRFFLYSIFGLIAIFALLTEVVGDINFLNILAAIVATFFSIDRIVQLGRECLEAIQEGSLYYWYSADDPGSKKIIQRLLPSDALRFGSLALSQREILIQIIINFRIGNFENLDLLIKFYRESGYNEFAGAVKYYEAELLFANYGGVENLNENQLLEIECLLKEGLDGENGQFKIIDPYIFYGFTLINSGKIKSGLQVLKEYEFFLSDQQKNDFEILLEDFDKENLFKRE